MARSWKVSLSYSQCWFLWTITGFRKSLSKGLSLFFCDEPQNLHLVIREKILLMLWKTRSPVFLRRTSFPGSYGWSFTAVGGSRVTCVYLLRAIITCPNCIYYILSITPVSISGQVRGPVILAKCLSYSNSNGIKPDFPLGSALTWFKTILRALTHYDEFPWRV